MMRHLPRFSALHATHAASSCAAITAISDAPKALLAAHTAKRHARRLAAGALALITAVGLSSCQTVQTTNAGAVGITRKQQMMVSAQEIEAASTQEYAQMVNGARQKGAVSRDAALNNRVYTIAKRLIPHVGVFRPDAVKWNWDVTVFESNEVNAFCMAGGKIGVYTGLIRKLNATDDELAAVIGHEIAHALREHVREDVSRQMATQMGLQILSSVATKQQQMIGQLGPILADVTFNLPRSREAEIESDRMGVELAARAGYNPRAAISLWQKMAQLGGARPAEFMSTHPSPENRIQDLEAASKLVQGLYKK